METPKKNKAKEDENNELANRARNRTVMLPRDVTGQVRSRLSHIPPEPKQEHYQEVAEPQPKRVQKAAPTKNAPVMGFLVSYDNDANGEVVELRSGRMIVSSEEVGAGDHLLVEDPSVSPMHAIVRISHTGEIQVLDQLSEQGTKITRLNGDVVELSGDKGPVYDGDILAFGNRKFHVCLVKRK